MRRRTLTLLVILIALVLVVGVIAIYGAITQRIVYVPGGSMMNTVIPGDRLFARKFSGEVKRGQVVVFQYRGDSTYHLGRVIGLPNETLEVRDTSVYINGNKRVKEARVMVQSSDPEDELREISTEGKGRYRVFYEATASRVQDPSVLGPHPIPPGHYFMMGDNRDNSEDSRYRGPVPRELIWGEAFRIYFSTRVKTDEFRWNRLFKSIQ
jgi:signal peptidase I